MTYTMDYEPNDNVMMAHNCSMSEIKNSKGNGGNDYIDGGWDTNIANMMEEWRRQKNKIA